MKMSLSLRQVPRGRRAALMGAKGDCYEEVCKGFFATVGSIFRATTSSDVALSRPVEAAELVDAENACTNSLEQLPQDSPQLAIKSFTATEPGGGSLRPTRAAITACRTMRLDCPRWSASH